jgi:hypothetical protein
LFDAISSINLKRKIIEFGESMARGSLASMEKLHLLKLNAMFYRSDSIMISSLINK